MEQKRRSLDEIELDNFRPFVLPDETPYTELAPLSAGTVTHAEPLPRQLLDGEWELVDDEYHHQREDVTLPWHDALKVQVPNSVHTNLYEEGLIPDPMVAINDKYARANSHKTWWYKKTFTRDELLKNPTLGFDGVCYYARFWLNGEFIGIHRGMFGGPYINVADKLKDENVLIVKIEDAPCEPDKRWPNFPGDTSWVHAVVINCVYGWHYAWIPSRGIWRSVYLESTPKTPIEKPFLYTSDHEKGLIDLYLVAKGAAAQGKLRISVRPKSFEGQGVDFETAFTKEEGDTRLHYRMAIPDHKLWWPLGHGDPNLYEAEISFIPENDLPTYHKITFGIRTVEMAPLPGGPYEDKLNFTYVINGKPIFVKGTNWCTTDALLRFPKERYRRFLTLMKQQHVQLLRAWGGGMPESDEFYDLCDELGIMVRQEWPTGWDSESLQPLKELEETIVLNTARIRNHPSLVTYACGNENWRAESQEILQLARVTLNHDGTRTVHRTSPWGGGIHNYFTYWGMKDLDVTLQLEAPFIGEFGVASAPNIESVRRYLPEAEQSVWPAEPGKSFYYHMPKFNKERMGRHYDIDYMNFHIPEFSHAETMADWVWATQMVHATPVRHQLERMRSRWPEAVGVCYYKATDVYPACSWATVDYYGVPKQIPFHVFADSYAPVGAALIFNSVDVRERYEAPVFFFDDNDDTLGKRVKVTVSAYDSSLTCRKQETYDATGKSGLSTKLGHFVIDGDLLTTTPLLLTAEVEVDGVTAFRTFWWLNFRAVTGSLCSLHRTRLAYRTEAGKVTVTNAGDLPAVGVTVECPDKDTTFEVEDSVLFLKAGESVTLTVNETEGVRIKAWNADEA